MSPAEVAAVVDEIREKVRARHGKTAPDIYDFELPSLEPLHRAREIAEAKTASIGSVNPRRPGALNSLVQIFKKTIARSLNWLVREQVDFNRAAVVSMDRQIETLSEINGNLLRVANEFSSYRQASMERLEALERRAVEFDARLVEASQIQSDLLKAWHVWRPQWEEQATQTEIRFLHALREIEARAKTDRQDVQAKTSELHAQYGAALARTTEEIQQRLWADLAKLKAEQEKLIHTELTMIRRKAAVAEPAPAQGVSPVPPPAAMPPSFDYQRFEERFRGSEEHVRGSQGFYLPFLEGRAPVADIGCGRGELLQMLADRGVAVLGADLDAEAVAACREKGLAVERRDLFEFLAAQPDASLGAVVCAHVVEHLPPARLPELMDLAQAKLQAGGVVAFETPNPGCLAIFAGDFYLDPTHVKPVPSRQLDFLLREAGFGGIEVHERQPAVEIYPELAALDGLEGGRAFRERFFGGLDYAIIARKL